MRKIIKQLSIAIAIVYILYWEIIFRFKHPSYSETELFLKGWQFGVIAFVFISIATLAEKNK